LRRSNKQSFQTGRKDPFQVLDRGICYRASTGHPNVQAAVQIIGGPPDARDSLARTTMCRQARIDSLMDQVWAQFGHTKMG
jgi:hypothetical protein